MQNTLTTSQPRSAVQRLTGYGLVLLAGIGWACLGLFFRWLQRFAVPPLAVAFARAALATLLLGGYGLLRPARLRVRRRDLSLFVAYGAGVAVFFWIYIAAVEAGSVALAAVLLYSAPIWIVLWARVRWGEPLTGRVGSALGLAVGGSALVALGGGPLVGGGLALGLGLASGVAYALYSLFSSAALQRGYAPLAVVFYAMAFGALFLLPMQRWAVWAAISQQPGAWLPLLGIAGVSTVLAPVCYAAGQRRIGMSQAGILATIEPVLAALFAWTILGEALSSWQWLGCAGVLAAVVVLARRPVARQSIIAP